MVESKPLKKKMKDTLYQFYIIPSSWHCASSIWHDTSRQSVYPLDSRHVHALYAARSAFCMSLPFNFVASCSQPCNWKLLCCNNATRQHSHRPHYQSRQLITTLQKKINFFGLCSIFPFVCLLLCHSLLIYQHVSSFSTGLFMVLISLISPPCAWLLFLGAL